jgi:hypothetical protein
MTLSPQNAHGIDLRILAGSGSGIDIYVTEKMLSLEADIIQLVCEVHRRK